MEEGLPCKSANGTTAALSYLSLYGELGRGCQVCEDGDERFAVQVA